MSERYELKADFTDWVEVPKAEWIRAERAAGFRPKMASDDPRYMDTPATGGFYSSGGISGRIRYEADPS